jgi:hypothetical protein
MSFRRYGKAIIGNSYRSEYPLDDNQIMRFAPSIFAQDKHESRSKIYTYIPTIEILQVLKKEGFFPFMVAQSRSRIEGKENFTKHMIRLRRPENINKNEVGEIILINSHDGTSSYQMMAGYYRFVCQNGLVIGDDIENYRIHHKGDIKDNIIEVAYNITSNLDTAKENVEEMKAIELNPIEKEIFAESALMLRYEEKEEAPIDSNLLLTNRRIEDRKNNDLWTTYNKVQENIIKGGLLGKNQKGNKTRTREVKSIDNNIKLNKALWNLTMKMAELKG